ncbi:MAG: hypothetical protein U0800_13305 [Isosphaeraceae bacterium]
MRSDPFVSKDYGAAAKEVLAKAGTVCLPYPPPASGRLYLGIDPTAKPLGTDLSPGSHRFFLRLVHKSSESQTITRIVDLRELRGVGLPPGDDRCGGVGNGWRVFRSTDQLAEILSVAAEKLKKVADGGTSPQEICVFEDAVIYVPEVAPVFTRIVQEYGVTAAESAEHASYARTDTPQCDCNLPAPHEGDEI